MCMKAIVNNATPNGIHPERFNFPKIGEKHRILGENTAQSCYVLRILVCIVESVKELATLDGSIIISDDGIVEAAGRHLDAPSAVTRQLRGLGARHRAAAGMTRKTSSVAVVVSESTGKVTVFEKGRIVATLEPVISRRLV